MFAAMPLNGDKLTARRTLNITVNRKPRLGNL